MIPSRVHDPKKPGDLLKVGGDPLDDVMDSARYGLYSYHTKALKPLQMRIDERVKQLWDKSDPISAMMQVEAIRYEEKQRENPLGQYYGGNIRHRLAEEARRLKG